MKIHYLPVKDQQRPNEGSRKSWYEPLPIIQPIENVGLYKFYYYSIEIRGVDVNRTMAVGIRNSKDFESECFPIKEEQKEIKNSESKNSIIPRNVEVAIFKCLTIIVRI